MKNSSKNAKSQQKYEDLGRIISNVFETGYLDASKSYKMSFLKGLIQGLGGVIGATVGIALLLWLLSLFGELPFVGEIFKSVQNAIND